MSTRINKAWSFRILFAAYHQRRGGVIAPGALPPFAPPPPPRLSRDRIIEGREPVRPTFEERGSGWGDDHAVTLGGEWTP